MQYCSTSSKKTLIAFAHRGEAIAFLKSSQLKTIEFPVAQLYEGPEFFLLITKEGASNTMISLSSCLSRFHSQISDVLNLGVAGALAKEDLKGEKIEISNIYRIRTHYAQGANQGNNLEYQTYSNHHPLSMGVDCISTWDRVKDAKIAQYFSEFAPIVDRESYWMAMVCAKWKVPFESYKVISDFADQSDICQLVKEKSELLAQQLYDFYQSQINGSDIDQITADSKSNILFTKILNNFIVELESQNFYLTMAQKNLLKKYLCSFQADIEKKLIPFLNSIHIEQFHLEDLRPKDKTQKLLEHIKIKIDPFQGKLEQEVNELIRPLEQSGIQIKWLPYVENKSFELKCFIQSKHQWQRLQQTISNFSYKSFEDKLDGDFNVDT